MNFFPGLGAGYLYKRRWIPYFTTVAIATIWFTLGAFLANSETEPSEIERLVGLGGLLFISITTMIEANFAYRRSVKEVQKEPLRQPSDRNKRGGGFGR